MQSGGGAFSAKGFGGMVDTLIVADWATKRAID